MTEIQLAYQDDGILELLEDYTNMLIQQDETAAQYLLQQNYDYEREHLEEIYGLPLGRFLVVKVDNEIVGCVGLKHMEGGHCELKRLYVKEAYRGQHLSDRLMEAILKEAKSIGYHTMYLDTLPYLKEAIHLYRKYGFFECEPYNDSPMASSIYMRLDLID
ncbi:MULTISPECIES: GNAT family N-acetyltransferase [Bacillota]|jgi:N-acetylglutamate synthase-like GNAT family acetyltransferase|uniref:GNAT family N-acetyltransferase n=2 Tax=Amedibacillus TaxID=2749846 RepID=A0A7G9GSE6_9FIRM|nr:MULTISPECIES: GNAT family N-acetyltransferase [Bacillota]QNM13728.1 GNAT family N-acetyltransferase [[Eubacterium] hominis]MCH4283704.1 GNAT family N-acetyltransferase [Amedibacillus hominis]RGB56512.1 GNAT family N-acetyltransferase [Absiella sp. AM10-20]RGB56675.1 GNAT family N-acetyltransferase [Absiella sp. AM22-9]RGB69090.1 GNAT family N-acetyltransferase [Absiella sp. AM09-45]